MQIKINKKQRYLLILSLFFFSIMFSGGILTTDALNSYVQSNNLLRHYFDPSENINLVFNNPIWILQDLLIIIFFKIFNFFVTENILIFITKYFIATLHSFYTCLAFCLCFYLINSRYNNKLDSIFLSLIIFFGTGLITFFSSPYIENLIILLIFIRIYVKNKFVQIITEILLPLIKPYYLALLLYYVFFSKKKLFNKFFKQLLYFLTILFLVFLQKIFFDAFNYTPNDAFNFNIISFIQNFRDIFYSNSSGILNTLTIILILILFGSTKQTFYKIICLLIFLLFLSLFNFWYAHLPMSGRYILSVIPFFFSEIQKGFNFFVVKKKFLVVKFFFIFAVLINFINLPTLNIKNTSYKHYHLSSVKTGNFDEIKLAKYHHPINNSKFHQFYFNYKYFNSLILSKKNFIFQNEKINLRDIYPSVGLLRLKYVIKNFDKLKNNPHIPEFINSYTIAMVDVLILSLINAIVFLLITIYIFINLKVIKNLFKNHDA